MGTFLHRLLYFLLPLPQYLRVVSRALFTSVKWGMGRYSSATEYIYHLPKLISKGGVAIDIGANLGYYTRPLSDIVGECGEVHSVEPVPVIFDVLRRNVAGRRNVVLHNVALGEQECEVTMCNDSVAECGYFGTGRNGVGQGKSESSIEFRAKMVRGSELFGNLERLDLIKCDIEGYEMVVIPEMLEIIERHRPVVLIETGDEQRKEIVKIFTRLNYRAFTLELGEEIPLNRASKKDIIFRAEEKICE